MSDIASRSNPEFVVYRYNVTHNPMAHRYWIISSSIFYKYFVAPSSNLQILRNPQSDLQILCNLQMKGLAPSMAHHSSCPVRVGPWPSELNSCIVIFGRQEFWAGVRNQPGSLLLSSLGLLKSLEFPSLLVHRVLNFALQLSHLWEESLLQGFGR